MHFGRVHLSLAARPLSSLPIAHRALVGRLAGSYFLIHLQDYRGGGDEEDEEDEEEENDDEEEEEDNCGDGVEGEEDLVGDDAGGESGIVDHKYFGQYLGGWKMAKGDEYVGLSCDVMWIFKEMAMMKRVIFVIPRDMS